MKDLSSHKSIFTVLGGAFLCIAILALTSCDNFFRGAQETKDEIAAAIAYNNAPKMTVQVNIGNSDYGVVYPTSFTGAVGDEFVLTFAKKQNVSFKFWSCKKNSNGEESNAIVFSDEKFKEDKENETTNYTVKVTIKSIEQNLTVSPKCYLTGETTPPTLTSATIKAQDSSGNYTRELTKKDFAQWSFETEGSYKFGDLSKNRINTPVFITVAGKDDQSGLNDVLVKETCYRTTDGSEIQNPVTKEYLYSIEDECQKNEDGSLAIIHNLKTMTDGILKIEVVLVDSCGNESVSSAKSIYYILKDTGIDNTIFKPEFDGSFAYDDQQSGNAGYWNEDWTYVSGYNIGEPFLGIRKTSDKGIDSITLTVSRDKLSKTIYSDFSETYNLEILWGYSETNMQPVSYNVDTFNNRLYSFDRDSKKLVYLKCIASDSVGNKIELTRAFPPQMDFDINCIKWEDISGNYPKAVLNIYPYEITKYKNLCKQIGADDFDILFVKKHYRSSYGNTEINDYCYVTQNKEQADFDTDDKNAGKPYYYYVVGFFKFSDNSYFYSPISTTCYSFELDNSFNNKNSTIKNKKILPEKNYQTGTAAYINNNYKISVTPVQNSGYCKIKLENYKTESASNVTYTFACLDTNTSQVNVFTEPEFYLPSPGTYKINISTVDENGYSYTASATSFYVNNSQQTSDQLVLTNDVTPPEIPQKLFHWYLSTPWAVTPYRYQGGHPAGNHYTNEPEVNYFTPNDENIFYNNKNLGEISYYFLPNSNISTYSLFNQKYTEEELSSYSAKTLTYDLNQLDYTIPQMMARSDTNALDYSEAGIHNSFHQMTIEIPYDGLDEGLYTLCIKAKDTEGNYSYAFTPVFNRLMGSRLDWTFDKTTKTITFPRDNGFPYYYDYETKRWIRFYGGLDQNSPDSAYDLNYLYTYYFYRKIYDKQDWFKERWMRIIAYHDGTNIFNSGFFDVEYVYLDYYRYKDTAQAITCKSKNYIEGGANGLQVFADAPVLVHTLYCSKKLTEGHGKEDATVWENKAMDTGVVEETGSFTYTADNLDGVPVGYWYTTIIHFADGDVLMTEVRQK